MNFLMNVYCWVSFFSCICIAANTDVLESPRVTNDCSRCHDAGIRIKSSLDESVHPCENFYQFACGGWIKDHAIPENGFLSFIKSKFKNSSTFNFWDSTDNVSSTIKNYVDQIEQPCDGSNQYACGGRNNSLVIPENRYYVSVLTKLQQYVPFQIWHLLNMTSSGNEPDFFRKIKVMFNTCMDERSIEIAGDKPLKKILIELEGWPVVKGDSWYSHTFNWTHVLVTLRKMGYDHNILFHVSVTKDLMHDSLNILKINKPSFGIDPKSLINGMNDSSTASYLDLMIKAAHLLALDDSSSMEFERKPNIVKEMKEALNFEIMLAKISLLFEERPYEIVKDPRITVQDLINRMPEVEWRYFLNNIVMEPINEKEYLIIKDLDALEKIVRLTNETSPRVVANYMIWRAIHQSLPLLSKDWRNLDRRTIDNPLALDTQHRWQYCASFLTDNYLGMAVTSYYVRHYFKNESVKTAHSMTEYIHEAFIKMLGRARWMDEETFAEALDKALTISYHIGCSTELSNYTFVSDTYKNLYMNDRSYFDNALSVRKWATNKYYSQLRKPKITKQLEKHAERILVNPFYNPKDNNIVVHAGIFQDPYFNPDQPNYLNFGALGSLIGFALAHAFYDKDRPLDKDGNKVKEWSDYTMASFKENAQCFIKQYNDYRIEFSVGLKDYRFIKVDGNETLDENIADNGGLKAAYLAYQAWAENNTPEPLLPNLNYTQQQLFWISAAQARCEKADGLFHYVRYLTNSHIPQNFRIIGAMSNLPDFVRDFDCSCFKGMDRKNKCRIW